MNGRNFIYISGVHATGKTTTVNALKSYLVDPVIVDLDRWFLYDPDIYFHNQMDRLTTNYEAVRAATDGLVLCDRSPYDTLIYSKALLWHGEISEREYRSITRAFQSLPTWYRAGGKVIWQPRTG